MARLEENRGGIRTLRRRSVGEAQEGIASSKKAREASVVTSTRNTRPNEKVLLRVLSDTKFIHG